MLEIPSSLRCRHADCGFAIVRSTGYCGIHVRTDPPLVRIDGPHVTLYRSAEWPGELSWVGGGCDICEENASASPIPDDGEWPNPGPPCHPGCDCEVEWSYLGDAEAVNDPNSELAGALEAYQDDYSGGINRALRSGDDSADVVKLLDQAIASQGPMQRGATAWRAFADMTPESHPKTFRNGAKFVDKGFVSTSLERDIAATYAGDTEGTLVEVAIPKGSAAYNYLEQDGDLQQAELLLARGTTFQMEEQADGSWLAWVVKQPK